MALYDDLGGSDGISAALDHFYGKVLADPKVSGYFDGVDVEAVKEQQAAFLAMAFGGPNHYGGRDLRSAHARTRAQGLDEDSFDAFMGHFRDTLDELGVGPSTRDEVMAIAYSGKDDVLDH